MIGGLHAARMRKSHGIADLEKQPQSLRARRSRFAELIEPFAVHALHDVEKTAVGQPAGVVYRHDSGMLDTTATAELPTTPHSYGCGRLLEGNHFVIEDPSGRLVDL